MNRVNGRKHFAELENEAIYLLILGNVQRLMILEASQMPVYLWSPYERYSLEMIFHRHDKFIRV